MPGTKNSGGRNRRTRAQHELAGTTRKHRHRDVVDVEVPPGRPTPPKKLNTEARAEWDRMVTRLELAKTVSLVDDAVLARYCQLHARAERLETAIAALKSPFYLDHLGNEKVHPAFAQLRAHDQALRGYLVEFGLTPAARTRVKPTVDPGVGAGDPFAEFTETAPADDDAPTRH